MIQDIFQEGFMRTYLIRAALALGIVLAVSGPAAAQSVVRGTVIDAEGNPIEGATVTIEATESNRRTETTTNDNGEFMQIGLSSGAYNVTVTKDDLRAIQPANITQGAPTELDFQLTPTSGMTEEQIESQRARLVLVEGALEAMRAGQDAEAIKLFNELVVETPTCGDCYYNLGLAHSNLEQYDEAEASFQKAIEMAPTSAAYTGLTNVYNAQQRFDLAAEAGAKAAELGGGGNNAEALYNQGVILWNAGDFAEAKDQFQAAVDADPSMAMAHYQLGMANLNLGQIPEARQAFEEYLEADPDGPKAGEVKVFVEQLPQ
jgi:tetratricopeptide (TPR) repeat protein